MTGATLFSGIGAPEVACSAIDWKWCAEIEKFPSAVLKHRFPHVPNLGDVTRETFLEDASRYGPIDLVVAGSPCQSFSVAGRREGMASARGNLALRFVELVAALRPRWILFENVPGLLSSTSHPMPDSCRVFLEERREGEFGYDADEGSDFGCFLAALSDIGYRGAYASLDAQYFKLAQRRERVFVVCHLGGWEAPTAVLFDKSCLQGNPAPCREAGQDSAGTLGGGAGERGWCPDTDRMTFVPEVGYAVNAHPSRRIDGESETFVAGLVGYGEYSESSCGDCGGGSEMLVAHPLRASCGDCGGGSEMLVAHPLRAEGFDASEDGTVRGIPIVASSLGQRMRAGGLGYSEETAPTLGSAPSGSQQAPALLQKMAVRRLTVVECARLQGFPDTFCHIPWKRRKIKPDVASYLQSHGLEVWQEKEQWYTKVPADGPMYRAYGNSMAINVMKWILNRILQVDEIRGGK
jgi:DNA (cytosine-5)-methyltransferase 1